MPRLMESRLRTIVDLKPRKLLSTRTSVPHPSILWILALLPVLFPVLFLALFPVCFLALFPVCFLALFPVLFLALFPVLFLALFPVLFLALFPVLFLALFPVLFLALFPVLFLALFPVLFLALQLMAFGQRTFPRVHFAAILLSIVDVLLNHLHTSLVRSLSKPVQKMLDAKQS
ncbi:hypothetical protein F5878DRAFT_233996 [Lentinula raphanica]|uniref:Uncharacterized protein n=1 Tax=Lentinula raphanica TaxID=153919 RepID=A0AA38UJN9_9AGAR|nr:hypothetical protein F5878DRAFT_233996 [Lentinula raphanica]